MLSPLSWSFVLRTNYQSSLAFRLWARNYKINSMYRPKHYYIMYAYAIKSIIVKHIIANIQ